MLDLLPLELIDQIAAQDYRVYGALALGYPRFGRSLTAERILQYMDLFCDTPGVVYLRELAPIIEQFNSDPRNEVMYRGMINMFVNYPNIQFIAVVGELCNMSISNRLEPIRVYTRWSIYKLLPYYQLVEYVNLEDPFPEYTKPLPHLYDCNYSSVFNENPKGDKYYYSLGKFKKDAYPNVKVFHWQTIRKFMRSAAKARIFAK